MEKKALIKLHQEGGFSTEIKEELLWHGTRKTHPSAIYAGLEESFDLIYANNGMWGRGLYFAKLASYSDSYYAYNTPNNTKLLILARVMVGDSIELPSDSSLKGAPLRENSKIPYDSVKGETMNHEIYILYRMRRAYPEYVIEYGDGNKNDDQ